MFYQAKFGLRISLSNAQYDNQRLKGNFQTITNDQAGRTVRTGLLTSHSSKEQPHSTLLILLLQDIAGTLWSK